MSQRLPRPRVALAATRACVVAAVVAACADDSPLAAGGPEAPRASRAAGTVAAAVAPGASVSVRVQVPASMASAPFDVPRSLTVPPHFSVRVYARVPGARFMAVAPNGDLLVSRPYADVVAVVKPDASGNGVVSTWASGLTLPHDIVFHTLGGVRYVYVAESDKIGRYVYNANGTAGTRQVLISGLPDNSSGALQGKYGHQLKNIALSGSNLYVSVASPSNADPADLARTPKGGAIYLYPATGGTPTLYARGLRNAEGLAIEPGTTNLWAAVNNRDNIAYPFHKDFTGDGTDDYGKVMQAYVDNHPPEEFTRVRSGGNYGWPLCNPNPDAASGLDDMPFDRDVQNNPTGAALDCATADRVTKGIQAHSAPLGLTFWAGANVPSAYAGGAVIALHGSWNRSVPTGYKLAYFPWSGGRPGAQVDLVTGFRASGTTWARPVDVAVAPDGGLFISDDQSGTVYKLTYTPPPPPPSGQTGLLSSATGRGCLAVTGSTSNAHAKTSLVTCMTGAVTQTWTLPATGVQGAVKANGVCLSAWGTASGASVGTDACAAGATSQQWTRSSLGELRTPGAMCVVPSSIYGIILRPCNGTSVDQRWTVK
jgi:glucose/arabinose dehydrogenase